MNNTLNVPYGHCLSHNRTITESSVLHLLIFSYRHGTVPYYPVTVLYTVVPYLPSVVLPTVVVPYRIVSSHHCTAHSTVDLQCRAVTDTASQHCDDPGHTWNYSVLLCVWFISTAYIFGIVRKPPCTRRPYDHGTVTSKYFTVTASLQYREQYDKCTVSQ